MELKLTNKLAMHKQLFLLLHNSYIRITFFYFPPKLKSSIDKNSDKIPNF